MNWKDFRTLGIIDMTTNSAKVELDLAEKFECRVFPARPHNKAPLIKNWQERASSNPKDITDLFQSSIDARTQGGV